MKKIIYLLLVLTLLFTACTQPKVSQAPETIELIQSEKSTSTIFETFYTYAGQGTLTLSSSSPVEIELFINDIFTQTYNLSENELVIDISAYTINGINNIAILYDSTFNGTLTLNHDYPTLSTRYTGDEFTAEELNTLDEFINNEVEAGFPGAVLMIVQNGEIVKQTAYGNALIYDGMNELETKTAMTTDTLFDLASITKVYSTTFAMMKLEDEGLIETSDYVSKYLTGFDQGEKSLITIENLLTHTAGFNSSYRFFDPDSYLGEEYYSLERDKTMSLLGYLPLSYTPSTDSIYSDLGFMTLGAIVEKVSDMTLDTYVEDNIYKPLNLTHTLYTPLDKGISQDTIAATERVGNTRDYRYEWPEIRTYTLQGEVHDELAYYAMNGISGNAGLFSNAYELAVLSQMILNGGGYGNVKIFEKETVEKYTLDSTLYDRYCLGFDNGEQINNYRRYSLLASEASIGKTGWTGTLALIDPEYDLVVILLTNKRHTPYENGNFLGSDYETGQYAPITTMIYEMLLDKNSYDNGYTEPPVINHKISNDVLLGIDRIYEFSDIFENQSIGLITNASGKNSEGISTIDVLYENVSLAALFSPEHGLDGVLEGGERYMSSVDETTELPIYSLYGDTLKPTDAMLENLDVLAFDIQDVGARFYTYIYTMINAMEACAENNVTFVVFDRPNPLGGLTVEGNLLEVNYRSFVGNYGLPTRYGLTIGELAMYINETQGIGCDLTVIPMEGWDRSMYYDDTLLEFTKPSPNMTTVSTAIVYPGTCLIEGTNISEGRGTENPLEMIGAPFINPYTLANELNSYQLEGVTFVPTSFMPTTSKYVDQLCYGVRIKVEDKGRFQSVDMGLSLIYALNSLYPNSFKMTEGLNYLAGTDLISLIEDKNISREELLTYFETPTEYIDEISSYYLY
jgi:N-acetylmuramoyl-L-alanine amidase